MKNCQEAVLRKADTLPIYTRFKCNWLKKTTKIIVLLQYHLGQTVLFLTIWLNASHLFAHSFNVKQFYLTHRWDPIRCCHSESEWTWEQWHWRGTPQSSKLQDWSLSIRWFNIISWILVSGGYPSVEMQLVYSTALAD